MADKKKEKHRCPEIDKAVWNVKITGPAYTRGMTTADARAAWFAYVRVVNAAVRPMPRKNY
jgi:hypothetical protein